jgi:anti-anti-sigma regulatory factor
MAVQGLWLNVDGEGLASALQAAEEKLTQTGIEVIVNFSSVRRIDLAGLRAIEHEGRLRRRQHRYLQGSKARQTRLAIHLYNLGR